MALTRQRRTCGFILLCPPHFIFNPVRITCQLDVVSWEVDRSYSLIRSVMLTMMGNLSHQ